MPYERSVWTDDFEKYRDTVSQYLEKYYCLTWHDACGDEAPIRTAIEVGETPTEFAEWWATKYDLIVHTEGPYGLLRLGQRRPDDQDRTGL